MTTAPSTDSDPFADPNVIGGPREYAGEATLSVGRNASLTLGTDSLIVLGTLNPHLYVLSVR